MTSIEQRAREMRIRNLFRPRMQGVSLGRFLMLQRMTMGDGNKAIEFHSDTGWSGEVGQQSPDHSLEDVLATGSSANLTSVFRTDPRQNSQSSEISHHSSQSNEIWFSASDEDHQDQSSQQSGSDSSWGINATSTTEAAPTSCRDLDASDNQGFHNACCGGESLSSNERKPDLAPRFGKRAKPSPRLSTDQPRRQFMKIHLRWRSQSLMMVRILCGYLLSS